MLLKLLLTDHDVVVGVAGAQELVEVGPGQLFGPLRRRPQVKQRVVDVELFYVCFVCFVCFVLYDDNVIVGVCLVGCVWGVVVVVGE